MKRWVKNSIAIGGGSVILIFAAITVGYFLLRKSIPSYNGTIHVKGIKSEVKIYRDSVAVPYIYAKNQEDAAFALGYVQAQERMFQMDLMRRAAEGRLSEIFGSKTVPFDKMFRTLGLYKIARREFKKDSPLSKKFLIAYSKGVNAYLKKNKGNYSIEFDVLHYKPQKWKPEESIAISKLFAWELNISWWTDIAFADLYKKLGIKKVMDILPNFNENMPTIIPKNVKKFQNISSDFLKTDIKFRKFIGFTGTHIGSNSWVVNPKLSASGKVIMANDTHLALMLPGMWFVAVIRSDKWNVSGFTLPGLPAVVIGKNRYISWALTNAMVDDADFYVEQLDSSKTHYNLDGTWRPLKIVSDTIKVRDSSNVIFKIEKTFHGPIISNIHPYNILYPNKEQGQTTLSMKWTAFNFSDDLLSMLEVNKAKNWRSFKKALKYYSTPGQNFIYGDSSGNIGYILSAKIPIRNKLSSTQIYDGVLSTTGWTGYVPYSIMPKMYNPKQNFIASANNKISNNFPYYISNIWEPPSRIKRIDELLSSKKKYSIDDFKKYQMDVYSFYARKIVPYILNAFKGVKITDKNLNTALELLRDWNYKFNLYSQTPAIYSVFFQKLLENTLMDEMGKNLFKEYVFIANLPYRVMPKLLKENSSWFDNINTPKVETRDEIIRKSLSDALSELENKFGKNIALWQWGKIHHLKLKHPFNGFYKIIDKLVDIGPFEIGGDGTTIFNTEYSFTNPYNCVIGQSMRYLFDFSNPNVFYVVLPAGQSGHIFSKHYKDMTSAWLDGKYFKVHTDSTTIKQNLNNLLVLLPE